MEVRRPVLVLGLLLATMLAACSVGTYGEEQASMTPDAAMINPANETSFNTQITPLVSQRCVACHGTAQPPNLTSFAALQAPYKKKPGNTNILVTKGDHQGIQYFNATEKTTVEMWIDNLQ